MIRENGKTDQSMDEYCFGRVDEPNTNSACRTPWKIIIADDEPDVHAITRMVLTDFQFEGRRLEFLNAYSGAETKKLVAEHPDTAILLLDVVMETPDSGLEVVRHIRKELKNRIIQIVLRTGHAGHTPEKKIIEEYGINDYRSKAEITSQKLFNIITVLLRAYRQASSYHHLNESLKKELERRKRVEEELRKLHNDLESRVAERTAELSTANERLIREIEERGKTEQALRLSEERYRTLFENNPVETIIVDHDARVIGFNLARKRKNDRLPEIGSIPYSEEPGQYLSQALIECLRSNQTREFDAYHYQDRYLHIRFSPFSGGAIITTIDITFRKKAEEYIRASEKKYRGLFDTSLDGILFIGLDGGIEDVNPAFLDMCGFTLKELIGTAHDRLIPAKWKTLENKILTGQIIQRGYSDDYERECLSANGRLLPVIVRGWLVHDEEGRPVRILYLVRDITDKKKLEARLHHASKMEAIGTLAGGIAHDFNNILAAIVLNTEMALVEIAGNEEAAYSMEQVLNSSKRARELIDQILTFSRSAPMERKYLKIQPIIEETLRMLRAILPSTITIEKRIRADCGRILAGASQIQQLVMNLCNNAAQAMKKTGGTIAIILDEIDFETADPEHGIPRGAYVRLAVQDTGCGIDEEIMPHIFDPFFTTKAPGEGTGLGLSVVHGIVVGNEGYISVASEPGKGARFDIYFPRINENEISAADEISQLPLGVEHILLVDDEEELVHAGRKILERLGYRVTAVSDPVEAIERFARQPEDYGMVITDMTMPHLTGLDLARRILSLRPAAPIILCTGFNSLITREKALSLGIREMVMKPFETGTIAAVIRRILDQDRENSPKNPEG